MKSQITTMVSTLWLTPSQLSAQSPFKSFFKTTKAKWFHLEVPPTTPPSTLQPRPTLTSLLVLPSPNTWQKSSSRHSTGWKTPVTLRRPPTRTFQRSRLWLALLTASSKFKLKQTQLCFSLTSLRKPSTSCSQRVLPKTPNSSRQRSYSKTGSTWRSLPRRPKRKSSLLSKPRPKRTTTRSQSWRRISKYTLRSLRSVTSISTSVDVRMPLPS